MRPDYHPLQFTTGGDAADPGAVDAAVTAIAGATDVLVLAHGWNNDMRAAQDLFDDLADGVEERLRDPARRLVVLGVLWPSVRWADSDQVAGGGVSGDAELAELVDRIGEVVPDPVVAAELTRLAAALEEDPGARAEFLTHVRGLMPPQDEVRDDDAPPSPLRAGDADEVLDAVADAELEVEDDATPVVVPDDLPPGMAPDLLAAGTAGAGLKLRDLNPVRLVRQVLNTTTYYTMKDRAGKVGQRGVAPLLDRLAGSGVRIHLAGHSFGARVVTMAAATTSARVSSLTLLQGAFSHHGLAGADPGAGRAAGAFRAVLEKPGLRGPVVVTHTSNDKAVRLAYAIASRLARQAGASVGDAGDPYGGMGANGAVATDEAVEGTLEADGATYAFAPRRVHNLLADATISGHGDVRNAAVVNALTQAVLAAP